MSRRAACLVVVTKEERAMRALPLGRLLVADTGANRVYELTSSGTVSDGDPLAFPLSLGQSISITLPYCVGELNNGNCLVGSSRGLFIYNPASPLSQQATLSSDSFRAIEYFEGW
jgi:hypothetical protein